MSGHLNDEELERLTPAQRKTYLSGDDLAKGAWAEDYRARWAWGGEVKDSPLKYTPHGVIIFGVAVMIIALFVLPSSAPESAVVNFDLLSFKLLIFLSGMTAVVSGSIFATHQPKSD